MQEKVQKSGHDNPLPPSAVSAHPKKISDLPCDSGFREYVKYLRSPGRVLLMNLFAGMARGFGFFVGATVVVALVTVIVSKILFSIPWLTETGQWMKEALDPSNLKTIESLEFLKDSEGNIVKVIPKKQ